MNTLTAQSLSALPLETLTLPSPLRGAMPTGTVRVYAIAFDMDTDTLRKCYGGESNNNAYADIKKVLLKHGFNWNQGSVYFGDPQMVNAVTCVLAVMDVARSFPWFAPSVRDIRMLRIEEQNDLMDAVRQASQAPNSP